ncbi:3-hydroxyacyl-ACP dehydratase FabZ family protein [Pseudozobellia sp. WGM2]|uniref:3-hydroxyacyl-ACP dehydratase FabZ family protein n=1 Tax=Pseudozobellia sp. WGM2 TaxID=2787625 RepID=UPI001ADF14A7|nr:FabA/FabZ family ACP-dehydratase [Pseudozobellia sp. WGM2]
MNDILEKLPYNKPFLFVDQLFKVNDNEVEGIYTFDTESDFYKGHFKNNPVTPGVILTECCAQIGVVCLGIHLMDKESTSESAELQIGLSSSEMEFLVPVLPGETVKVVSKKVYFRFHKLKCEVKMYNSTQQLVCKGTIAGMINPVQHV